jgi:hypothetical protein
VDRISGFTLYNSFTTEVKRNCHFPAPGRNCYNIDKFIFVFYRGILDSYRETRKGLGGESCSSSREPESHSCVQLQQWWHHWLISIGWDLCLWTVATNGHIVYPPDDISLEDGGMILTGQNQRTRRKTCLSATLFTINPIWIDPGAKPGLRGEMTAINRLSHGTAERTTLKIARPCVVMIVFRLYGLLLKSEAKICHSFGLKFHILLNSS